MSGKLQRTFEVSAPVERVWNAFRDDGVYGRLLAWPDAAAERKADTTRSPVLEAEPMKRLRWSIEGGLPDRAEFTIVLESTETGTRFTVTRYSFGEGEIADVFAEAHWLGWTNGVFRNLIFYLETGTYPKQRASGGDDAKSCTGMMYKERDWGIEVLEVKAGSFAEEANLVRGDRLVRIGGVPIFTRNDIWGLVTEHDPGTELEVDYVRGRERRSGTGRLSDKVLAAWGE